MEPHQTTPRSHTHHQFSSFPVRDPTLGAVINAKELFSTLLAFGGPILFVFTVAAEPLAAHSWAWTILLGIWTGTCGLVVFESITKAIKLRRYARAVDSDAAELGDKLYAAERMQEGRVEIHNHAGVDLPSIEMDHLTLTGSGSDLDLDSTLADFLEQQRRQLKADKKSDDSSVPE